MSFKAAKLADLTEEGYYTLTGIPRGVYYLNKEHINGRLYGNLEVELAPRSALLPFNFSIHEFSAGPLVSYLRALGDIDRELEADVLIRKINHKMNIEKVYRLEGERQRFVLDTHP